MDEEVTLYNLFFIHKKFIDGLYNRIKRYLNKIQMNETTIVNNIKYIQNQNIIASENLIKLA